MPKQNFNEPLEGEVVNPQNTPSPASATEQITQALMDPSKNKNRIFIGTLNLMATPARALAHPLKKHYHRKYHGKYRHAKKLFVLDIILICSALALLGISLYFFFVKPKQNYLTVELENSSEAIIGASQNFTFVINNSKKNVISDTELSFEFPKTFSLANYPEKYNTTNNSVNLGTIKENEKIKLNFVGTIWGALNEKQEIAIKAHYKDLKTNLWNDEINLLPLKPTDSALKIDWTIPDQTFLGQNFNIVISYQNISGEILPRAIIIPAWPQDFQITSSNVDLIDGRFVLKDIPAGKSEQITIAGFLKSLPRNGLTEIKLQNFLEHDSKQYLQSDLSKTVSIKDNGVTLDFKIVDNKTFLKSGEEAKVLLFYRNNNKVAIKDINLILTLPPEITAEHLTKIILDKKTIPALTFLEAGQSGQTELTFKITSDLGNAETLEKNFSLKLRPSISFYLENEPQTLLQTFAQTQNIKISTFLKLHAESRYFTDDGDQLGRGPLPPKINQTTKYWINLFVTDSPNAVKDVTITGKLPQGAVWVNRTTVTEGDPIKFDPISRSFVWRTDYLEATPGSLCPCSGIGFEVAITPTADDIGRILSLVENLKVSATDIYTNEYLEKTTGNLTTDLKTDNYAKNKNKVTE